ncbi:Uma2 family endonuclease [Kitasatospora sp. NPDC057015]|uniref:Uma2 family endonuclease n=1 Tax=Kitasatospora sp. NPDC057015 TaxID=3346001 RepID=UPI00362AC398
MTAMAREADLDLGDRPDLEEVLWQAWLALELPEGFHAEIVEGFIEVSPTGRLTHALAANRLRRGLDAFLSGSGSAGYQDTNVIHGKKAWIPDVLVAAEEYEADPNQLGIAGGDVQLVAEVVSRGHEDRKRDRVRKRREYARAGIPVYVVIDDFDGDGHVTVLTDPHPDRATYEAETRVPYGTEVTVPEGPAKGFVIGVAITGEPRRA